MLTATCQQCVDETNGDEGCWQGSDAHIAGGKHEQATGHVVWYDDNTESEPVE